MSFPPSHLLQHSRQHLVSFAVQVLLPAVALTLLQIFLISFWSQEDDYASVFKGLTQWDSHWYLGIVRQVYQFVGFDKIAYEQSHVAFFPGYPLAVAAMSHLMRIEPEQSSQAGLWASGPDLPRPQPNLDLALRPPSLGGLTLLS